MWINNLVYIINKHLKQIQFISTITELLYLFYLRMADKYMHPFFYLMLKVDVHFTQIKYINLKFRPKYVGLYKKEQNVHEGE